MLDLYMRDMARHALLDAEEEIALAEEHQRGRAAQHRLAKGPVADAQERQALGAAAELGKQARRRLVLCNLRLVIYVAKEYAGGDLAFIDLVQEGNVGLIEAVDRYDHRRRVRFSTYAWWWIRQRMSRAIASQSRTVRLPVHVSSALTRLRRASRELESRLKRRPTPEELAGHMGMNVRKVRRLMQWEQRKVLSLQMPVGSEGESELGDLIDDRDTPSMEEIVAHRQLREKVRGVMQAMLKPRERDVLRLRFGLDGSRSRTLEQVAGEFGVTRERVRQIEARALRRLRHASVYHELRDAQT